MQRAHNVAISLVRNQDNTRPVNLIKKNCLLGRYHGGALQNRVFEQPYSCVAINSFVRSLLGMVGGPSAWRVSGFLA